MLSALNNSATLFAQNAMNSAQAKLEANIANLSTALRINSAQDDAAGMAIASDMTSQDDGMAVAMQNTQDGVSLTQTADGGLEGVTDSLLRMRDLAVQAGNGILSSDDRASIQSEYNQLAQNVGSIMGSTSFAGAPVLAPGGMLDSNTTLQVGPNAGNTLSVGTSMSDLANALTSASSSSALTTAGGASSALNTIDQALDAVGSARSSLGATSNRLDYTYDNLANNRVQTQAARSRIEDTDYANASSNQAAQNQLLQAAMFAFKQSNDTSASVLSLIKTGS